MHDDEARIDFVEVDGLVVLKIIQHANSHLPEYVTGHLLGLDRSEVGGASVIEVTSSFPYANQADDDADDQSTGQEYQMEMMRCLREINFDYNTVGWYTSSLMGSFLSDSTIESQFKFQEAKSKSVLLVYDPLRTSQQSVLSLRAFRLSSAFVELYKTQSFTKESISRLGLSFDDIYQEVPIKVHNAQLINALLLELDVGSSDSVGSGIADSSSDLLFGALSAVRARRQQPHHQQKEQQQQQKQRTTALASAGPILRDAELERLDLSGSAYLEKNLEYVIDCLDDLATEQGKFQYYQRNLQRQNAQANAWLQKRKAENQTRKAAGEEPLPETDPMFKPLPEPPRLDSLLIEKQLDEFCSQLNQFSAQSLSKLYLFDELSFNAVG